MVQILVNPYNVTVSRIVSDVFANDAPLVDFPNPGHTLLPIFPSFRSMGMVGETCLPSNFYYPRTPDYTLYSGVHVCWSEHSDSPFVYGFMNLPLGLWEGLRFVTEALPGLFSYLFLDYGLGTMTATAFLYLCLPMSEVVATSPHRIFYHCD